MALADQQLKALLESLVALPAVAGRETRVAQRVAETLRTFAADVTSDAMGNVVGKIAANPGAGVPRKKLLIAAHMDQIGLVVQSIDDSGAIRVAPAGGVNRRTLLGQAVIVHGRRDVPGMLGTVPPHLTRSDERKLIPTWDEMFIDVGLPKEKAEAWIRPGDPISFDSPSLPLQGTRFASKSLDNRAGLVAVLESGRRIAERSEALDVDVYIAATTQEELGLRGIGPLAFRLQPDAAVVVDVGFGDMPDLPQRGLIRLGQGPAITVGPNIHPGLRKALAQSAQDSGIPNQVEVSPESTGTDAWALQVVRTGVPTGLLSIPLRNMHSSVEVVDLADVEATATLLARFALDVRHDQVEGWNHGPFGPTQ